MKKRDLASSLLLPFQEFMHRHGLKSALTILLFIFFYKLGDSMATALATPFYLDLGF
jgi:MFS transporter, PAT family, beta-lactamase induction signal transducer AmpG